MKTKILSVLAIAAAAIGLGSCDSAWEPQVDSTGTVSLSSIGIEVTTDETVISRAGDNVDLSQFKVMIYTDKNELKQSWTYSSMPEIFTLPVGDYKVEVVSHDLQKAEFGKPYYAGSKTFSIADSKITEIGVIVCKFASIRVSVKFTEALRQIMSDDVRVSVVANDEGRLEFTPDETRSGYFAAVDGSTTLVARFRGTVKGYVEYIVRTYDDVAAGQHRVIVFDVKNPNPTPDPEQGSINPGEGVNVDVTFKDVALNEDYDPEEEIEDPNGRPGNENWKDPDPGPGPDEPEPGPGPEDPDPVDFDTDLSWDEPNPVESGKTYKVIIKAEAGVENLVVKIDSDNEQFIESLDGMLPQEFDLAYPGEYGPALSSIGLKVGEEVIGKPEVPFDITTLVPLLSSFHGTHRFTITVTDGDGNKVSKTLTFVS